MNIFLVLYRIRRDSPEWAERELDLENEFRRFVRHQDGPGKSWVVTEKSIDDVHEIFVKKIGDAGCMLVLSRDGRQRRVHPNAVELIFEQAALHSIAEASLLLDSYCHQNLAAAMAA